MRHVSLLLPALVLLSMLPNNICCFYRMPPIIISPFHLKENSTNAQRDGEDINFSFEPKGKAHASTKLPFGFEGTRIFHLEPKQNVKDAWRPCPVSALQLKAGVNLQDLRAACTHFTAGPRAGLGGPSGWPGVRAIWSPLSITLLTGSLSDSAPSFLQFPMLKSSDSSLVFTSRNCLLGSLDPFWCLAHSCFKAHVLTW